MKDTYNLTAPDIDFLLRHFDHGWRNASAPSQPLMDAASLLSAAIADLAPLKKNAEVKSIWLMIPKGTLSDYEILNPYEDMLEWEEVDSREEYVARWAAEYPDDICWYELIITECFNKEGKLRFRGVGLNNITIISANLEQGFSEHGDFSDEAAIALCSLLTDAAKKSMELLRAGTYNSMITASLPYKFRTGVVKRSTLWASEPERKEIIFEGLPNAIYAQFQALINSGENKYSKIRPQKSMTGNDFLSACAIGYRACGYDILGKDGAELPAIDLYLRYADGRDEGLTGKGDTLSNTDGGIDLNDPGAWDDWYHNRESRGGHPWEVCRGGNSTHIDLYVYDSRSDAEWELRLGTIDEKEAKEKQQFGGYYFSVGGRAWTRSVEAVHFYVALHNAGLPVLLQDADEILARFKGEDLIGIVSYNLIPKYCESLFPASYGKILDFMHVSEEDKWLKDVRWLPEEKAELQR